MNKRGIIISIIAGIFILVLCAKSAVGSGNKLTAANAVVESGDVPVIESNDMEEDAVSDHLKGQSKREKTEAKMEKEAEEENRIAVPREVDFVKPVVRLNDEKGELTYNWNFNSIRVDEETLLLAGDCYFPEEKMQQKIFFLAKAPLFVPQEVFRQDSRIWGEEGHPPYTLEYRMMRPHPVDGGYIYEVDGVLYFLDDDFQSASLICDLRQLMGDSYSFSPDTFDTCDVTEDASRMLACMDNGLYEYDLESGERKLLEPAYFAHHDIVLEEGDCACGERDFDFAGPVRAKYGPDGHSYAFLTGTEEADWGDITGAVLRSGEGKTLYQKETEYMYDFKWLETEETTYLAVFYTEYDGKTTNWMMDRVDAATGEAETFEVPKEAYWGGSCCVVAEFLDADSLLYINYEKQDADKGEDKNIFEVYRLSTGQRQDLEVVGEADWDIIVLDRGGYATFPVRCPK